MTEERVFKGLKYLISYPDGFDKNGRQPLIIFLHGAGTRSENTDTLMKNSCFVKLCKHQQKYGYVLLAPLCSVTDWNETMPTLIGLADEVINYDFIDKERVYLTGNSMGGYGTYELTSLRPDRFAAVMPVCGGGIPWLAGQFADVPLKTFHGLLDNVVEPSESLAMVRAINLKGGHAELVLYPDLNHNCWDRVYSNASNIEWLMQFTLKRDKSVFEDLSGDYYG